MLVNYLYTSGARPRSSSRINSRFARRRKLCSLTCLLLVCLLSPCAFVKAQDADRSSIKGTIEDASGASVADATVRLVVPPNSVVRSTRTDAGGRFNFDRVPPGGYELFVTQPGFAPSRTAIELPASAETLIRLSVGDLADEVTVTAESGRANDPAQIAQQVNVIGERALTQRTSAVLAQVAEEEPGVALQRTSASLGAIVVRGLTEVGVYVDGVRFTQATQRGGINTFFNLNEPTSLRAIEILRGTSSAQYGSESLGGVVQLISQVPTLGVDAPETHGEVRTYFSSADLAYGANTLVTHGTRRYGVLANLAARRANTLRAGGGLDSHAAVTRFLGVPSTIFGTRQPDTAFTQYGGTLKFSYAPRDDQQLFFSYNRSQQDGGKRSDQTLGGDGNLVADLRNLQLDFFYARYLKQQLGFFDSASATFSFNNQREERVNQGGQGNPLAAITSETERTGSFGFNFLLDKQVKRNTFAFGGDIYRDQVRAPAYSRDPRSNAVTITRGRVPDGARYILAGLFAQDAYELFPERLRVSGALRYNVASYHSDAVANPVAGGAPLAPEDSFRTADFSGRVGGVVTIIDGVYGVFNYSRGFRAPNITDLGSTGLVGVGFQVAANALPASGAFIGSTAGADAVSTNQPVERLRSQTSDNFDLGVNFRFGARDRFRAGATAFRIDYSNVIARQTLLLPQGAVGTRLGSATIVEQLASGAVIVDLASNPVLVGVNFGAARITGVESEFDLRIGGGFDLDGNYTFIQAEDPATGAPPNIGGGGIPPALGFLRLRYAPSRRYFVELSTNLAGRQTRLSSLDLNDRRTGAIRTRTQIANFFNRGARARNLIGAGADNRANTADDILNVTGETLAQVQTRVLGSSASAPLFAAIPGYGLVNLRGGVRLGERSEIEIDFDNIGDKNYRQPGWGIDGAGRSATVRYRYKF